MSGELALSDRRSQQSRRRRRKRKRSLHDAPFNSTSFLMADHSDTVQYLDRCLATGDYYCCSGEEDESFLCKEFLKDYNTVRSDRLVAMSKAELINEYVAMESRIEILEARLAAIAEREEAIKDRVHYDFSKGEVPMSPEIAEKIRIFQKEIHSLEIENIRLREASRASSDSSSSSSSSSSSGSSSSEDESEEHISPPPSNRTKSPHNQEESAVDTGYESAAHLRDEEDHGPDLISDNAVSSSS
eukprot:TRINITY_DN14975_c0_g1_i1.p1 TRINITY_DN14975_c0_g1~~TRINITY_DN14975_c0_g1_i1.p1  ORF type:complete len:244 (+),score=41.79 TRINITY_DN14975_c0_g1_i1:69-800(+)